MLLVGHSFCQETTTANGLKATERDDIRSLLVTYVRTKDLRNLPLFQKESAALKAIKDVAEKEKIDLVFGEWVYADPNLDITDPVNRKLRGDDYDISNALKNITHKTSPALNEKSENAAGGLNKKMQDNGTGENIRISFIDQKKLDKQLNIKTPEDLKSTNQRLLAFMKDNSIDAIINQAFYYTPEMDATDLFIGYMNGSPSRAPKERSGFISGTRTSFSFINADTLLKDAPIVIQAQNKIESEFKERDTSILKLKEAGDAKFESERAKFSKDLAIAKKSAIDSILPILDKYIVDYAKSSGLLFITQNSVFATKKIDITTDVISTIKTQ